ncbi:MAG: site-2 protease family protein [Clostridia bacterium]|nr:site-2 protease family protein [Clostridia bacterium]
MELKKLRIHPLFLVTGVLSAFTGGLLLFLIALVAALEHECAHAFVARRYGFSLDTVTLMPYGAVVSGDISGIGRKQEVAVLLAGPLANAFTALGFAALWWLFPQTYPYTDMAAYMSLSLFAVNLLPAYPLDGGRLLKLALSPLKEKMARIILTTVSLVAAAGILVWFGFSCTTTPQWTALALGIMLAAGALGSIKKGGTYGRVCFSREKSFRRGIEERRVMLDCNRPLSSALRFLGEERYLVLVLTENGEYLGEVTENEYLAALDGGDYSRPLREALSPICFELGKRG